jgi:hypothetical protein
VPTDSQLIDSQTIDSRVIARTQNWIEQFVIAHNLCPFASKVFDEGKVAYIVCHDDNTELHLRQLAGTLLAMDQEPGSGSEHSSDTQTCFYIYPDAYADFEHYLALVEAAEILIEDMGYTDSYQLASFHPQYLFDDADLDDAANYTNRSPFPMLHILRQQDITLATEHHPDIESVPQRNIKLLRSIGLARLQDALNRLIKA